MTKNRVYLALAAVLTVGFAGALSACSEQASVNDFAKMDSDGKPIQCSALISANTAETDQIASVQDEHVRPVALTAAQLGYAFNQCHTEIEADRHERCKQYATRLRQSLTGDPKTLLGPWLQFDHLPPEWTRTCAAEIRSGVTGVSDGYKVELDGPNPILDLDRYSLALPVSSVTKISMDARDANVNLWRVQLDTTSGDGYSLWFSTTVRATDAYDELRSAWKLTRLALQKTDHKSSENFE
jgi:hypothetical protein